MYYQVIFAIFLIAASPITIRFILQNNSPATASVFWSLSALIASAVWLVLSGRSREFMKLMKTHFRQLFLIGCLTATGVIGWFYSIELIGPELSSFLGRFGTVLLVFLSIIFLKERFNVMEGLGAAMTFIGVVVITFHPVQYLGWKAAFILIGRSCYHIAQLIAKKNSQISPLTLTMATSVFVFIIVLVHGLIRGITLPSKDSLLLFAVVPFFSEVLAVYLVYASYKSIGVAKSQIIRSGFPFIVILYSFALGNALPLAHQLLGGVMIIGGVILLYAFKDKTSAKGTLLGRF